LQIALHPVLKQNRESIAVVVGSHVTGLGIIRNLARGDVPVLLLDYEANPGAYSRHVTQALIFDYRRDWEQFVPLLCAIGRQLPQKAVLYLTDERYCLLCARAWQELSQYYHLPFNPETIMENVSKARQLELCRSHDIPIPWVFNIKSRQDLENLSDQAHDLPYPLIIRPFDKSEYFDTVDPFRILHLYNRQDLSDHQTVLERELSHGLVVAEYIPGGPRENWGMNAYCDENYQVVAAYTRTKISQYPFRGGTATIMEAPFNQRVFELGEKICQALEIIGPAAIEVKYDRRDDQYKYVETNFRYPRSGSMSLQAGVLVPLIHYYHITGQHDRLKGLRKVQQEDSGYYIEALWEWMNVVENRPRGEHLLRVLKTYLVPKRTWAVWDWQDPRPGMVYGWCLAGKALHRLKSRF
jgi:predicted ATP-grasp superfamily ATP-dependent carboligase